MKPIGEKMADNRTQAQKNKDRQAKEKADRQRNQNQKDEYVSPLKDELDLPVQQIGEGIVMYHNRETERVLFDVNIGTRRGLSSSGKNVKLATGSYSFGNKGKINLNAYDGEKSDEELDDLAIFLKKKAKDQALTKEIKRLENEAKALD